MIAEHATTEASEPAAAPGASGPSGHGRAGAPGVDDPASRAAPRPARPADVPEILRLVRELAEYERSLAEVTATEADLHGLLFGTNTPHGLPAAFCHVIDDDSTGTTTTSDSPAPRLAAFALWFLNASTWLGRHGIYLEDLYVCPAHRGRGHAGALMATLAGLCLERGYGRLEWSVLDWNDVALGFYESLGARPMDEWTVHRVTGDALRELAATAHPSH